ncbi:MAG: hypothetical protein QXY49_02135 [Thermofilaceae archaeon]
MRLKIYRNEDVKRIVVFIPEGHVHARLILELDDQTIILQEATAAAIVRAYASVAIHPTRRAVELIGSRLKEGKPSYAEYQVLESSRSEEEVLREAEEMWLTAKPHKAE